MDARNDLKAPLTKLCLALETARRTDEHARVAGSQEFLAFFFPHDETSATDRLFIDGIEIGNFPGLASAPVSALRPPWSTHRRRRTTGPI